MHIITANDVQHQFLGYDWYTNIYIRLLLSDIRASSSCELPNSLWLDINGVKVKVLEVMV